MHRQLRWVIVALMIILVGLFVAAKMRYSGRAPTILPAANCSSDLWSHVYQRERLKVVELCAAVEGRVVSVHGSGDGDLHIALDPDNKSALNLVNLMHGDGNLVVEAVCDHPPDEREPSRACEGFVSQVKAPNVGDRIRVVGAYVTDRENGWNEVHPVTRIDTLP